MSILTRFNQRACCLSVPLPPKREVLVLVLGPRADELEGISFDTYSIRVSRPP